MKKDEEKNMRSENLARSHEFFRKVREGLVAEPLSFLARMLDAAEKRGYENAALELAGWTKEKSDE